MTNILSQLWETHQGQTKMSPIRSVFFGWLSVAMEITQGDLRDKAVMWHFWLCLLNKAVLEDGKRKAVLEEHTSKERVRMCFQPQ